ncbi:MAG: type II toxin-antitoxin system VapC family toxin [Acidobacteriota bacterium]
MANAFVLDSYALLAHFEDEPGAERVVKLLTAAHAGETRLFLCVINWGEIFYSTLRERGAEKAEEVRLIIEQLPITLVDADLGLTLEAAKLKAAYPVAYADCFAAALGKREKANIVTGDPEFKRFGEDITLEWIGRKHPISAD